MGTGAENGRRTTDLYRPWSGEVDPFGIFSPARPAAAYAGIFRLTVDEHLDSPGGIRLEQITKDDAQFVSPQRHDLVTGRGVSVAIDARVRARARSAAVSIFPASPRTPPDAVGRVRDQDIRRQPLRHLAAVTQVQGHPVVGVVRRDHGAPSLSDRSIAAAMRSTSRARPKNLRSAIRCARAA